MAEEIPTSDGTAPASITKEKKTRGPRKPKIVAEAATSASVSAPVKKTRGRRKKTEEATVSSSAPVAAKKVVPVKRGSREGVAATPVSDGFDDLLKLEEENQKLRKALAEKLRAENIELRKKLGTS